MSRSRVVLALLMVIAAIVIQTTVFGAGRIQPFSVAPALVTLVIIAIAPYVEAEYNILLGFTAGLLMDLIGSGTLGIGAMSLTIVAYVASRVRHKMSDSVGAYLAYVVALTLLGQVVYVLLGTLFGQGTIGEPRVIAKILLPAVWNLLLAYPVMWMMRYAFESRDRNWAQ